MDGGEGEAGGCSAEDGVTDVTALPVAKILPPAWFPKEYSLRWYEPDGYFIVVWEEKDTVLHAVCREQSELLTACLNIGGARFEREYPGQHLPMHRARAEAAQAGKELSPEWQKVHARFVELTQFRS